MTGHIAVNARFLTRPGTGVDRAATELLRALGARPNAPGITCYTPNAAVSDPDDKPTPLLNGIKRSGGIAQGALWEQVDLPRRWQGDVLLSLCNTGPLMTRRQVVMIHDAQVFTQPQSYGRAFRSYYKALLPRLASRAALVLTVSDVSARELVRLGIVARDKVQVVPNGGDHLQRTQADGTALKTHGLEPKSYILALGSLAPHKNLKRLIAAAEARPKGAVPLVIAGGGDARVFANSGLKKRANVRVLGRISEPVLRALYEGATALAVPSLSEGFGLGALEAMSLGCPVIASTAGALPETCANAAILLDPLDTQAWSKAMFQVQIDQALRAELVEKGRLRAKDLSWARAAQALSVHLDPFLS
ncbi:MAG: glycosyltransferase family 4 protein [Sedimentitalea sp.]